jgi:hypothetical protein
MLNKILPQHIDNTYRGHKLALWLLGILVFMKGGIGLGTIFNGRSAAISADAIPLDTFTPAGAQAFVAIFAAWGLAQLVLNLIGLLVLVRYRAMVPFMFVVLLLEHLSRKLILWIQPVARSDTPPGLYLNLAFVAVMIAGIFLSLRNQRTSGENP